MDLDKYILENCGGVICFNDETCSECGFEYIDINKNSYKRGKFLFKKISLFYV